MLEPEYLGAREPHHIRCVNGHDRSPTPDNVLRGQGICKLCAWADQDVFYVVTGAPTLGLKFGITSGDPKSRLASHRCAGYVTIVRLFTELPQRIAAELEQELKTALIASGFSPVRGREYFGIDALPVVLGIVDRELALYTPEAA